MPKKLIRNHVTTIRDVAEDVGISIGVVSTVLNNTKNSIGVSQKNRERIIEAAKRMNYRPSILARSFQSKQSFLIGVMPAEVNASLLVEFLKGIREQLTGTDYSPLLEVHDNAQQETECLQRLMRRRIDGLLVTPGVAPDGTSQLELYAEARRQGVPIVQLFGRNIPDVPKVNLASFDIGHLQAQHLIALGHHRITLLTHSNYDEAKTGSEHHWDAWEHSRGYTQAMTAAKLEPGVHTITLPDERQGSRAIQDALITGGFDAASQLMASPHRPTAIVCYSDLIAMGLMQWCGRNNISIPGDLSVIGQGDSPFGLITQPALTTVAFPAREAGRQAVAQLLNLIRGQTAENANIPGDLIIRNSTGPATS